MPEILGVWGGLGWLNRFLFGEFGLFYPFALLPLNFIFYKRAYKLDNVKKSEFIGLCIAFVAAMLLFALFAKDANKDAGYIPEVLYTILGFVLGRLGTGFLSIVLLLCALVLVFPRFVELVFGVKVDLSVFARLDERIRTAISEFFGGKETSDEPKIKQENDKKQDEVILQDEPLSDENAEFESEVERKITPQKPAQAEFPSDESEVELNLSQTNEINEREIPFIEPVKRTQNEPAKEDEFAKKYKPEPRRTPDEIAEELRKQFESEFSQSEPNFDTPKSKNLQKFMSKAEFESDESISSPQKPAKPYVPEKFLKPKANQSEPNFDTPSFERNQVPINKAPKDESKPFEVIEKEPPQKPAYSGSLA